jgi:hypothetical protein
MNLAFDLGNGTALGLVGPTVFSIGADDKHIVVRQHPRKDPFGSSVDRSTTHYFVVARTTSPEIEERQRRVRGPLGRRLMWRPWAQLLSRDHCLPGENNEA